MTSLGTRLDRLEQTKGDAPRMDREAAKAACARFIASIHEAACNLDFAAVSDEDRAINLRSIKATFRDAHDSLHYRVTP